MKRLFVLPLIVLTLCGCSKIETATPILKNISFIAEIHYQELDFVASSNITNDALNLTVMEPKNIEDLLLTIDKNGITAKFKGISHNCDADSMPQSAAARILYDIFLDISGNKEIVSKDDNCVINGRVDEYKYIFTFAPSGLPINLEVDELDLYVNFKNVTVN